MDTIMANKKIRILVDQQIDGIPYRCNDVVDLPAEQAKPLIEQVAADDNKAAVAYCINELGIKPLVHSAPVVEEPSGALAEEPAEQPLQ